MITVVGIDPSLRATGLALPIDAEVPMRGRCYCAPPDGGAS